MVSTAFLTSTEQIASSNPHLKSSSSLTLHHYPFPFPFTLPLPRSAWKGHARHVFVGIDGALSGSATASLEEGL